jgi:uncharacterized membrane protein YhaH (DUF805 family)
VSFTEAVRDALSKYVTFIGRSSRSAYWWFYLFNLIAVIVAYVIDVALGTSGIFYGLTALALLLPNLAVSVRRLHDTGRSGWWLLIALIPLIGAIVLLVFFVQGSDGPNRWGQGPDQVPVQASGLA